MHTTYANISIDTLMCQLPLPACTFISTCLPCTFSPSLQSMYNSTTQLLAVNDQVNGILLRIIYANKHHFTIKQWMINTVAAYHFLLLIFSWCGKNICHYGLIISIANEASGTNQRDTNDSMISFSGSCHIGVGQPKGEIADDSISNVPKSDRDCAVPGSLPSLGRKGFKTLA